MSQAAVEVVRRFNEPHAGEDALPAIRGLLARVGPEPRADVVLAAWAEDPGMRYLHPEVVWDASAMGFVERAHGPVGVCRLWEDWVEGWTTYTYVVREYRDIGDWVLTVSDLEATAREGLPVAAQSFQLWRVQDGKVIAIRNFLSEAEALAAA